MRFDAWRNDVRYAWRNILRRPGFALLVMLTLALGIGVNSAVFALIDAVLLRPLPSAQADHTAWHGAHSFASLALIATGTFTLTGDIEPERVRGARVTASLMPLLGIAPRIGRAFSPSEDVADAAPVVI